MLNNSLFTKKFEFIEHRFFYIFKFYSIVQQKLISYKSTEQGNPVFLQQSAGHVPVFSQTIINNTEEVYLLCNFIKKQCKYSKTYFQLLKNTKNNLNIFINLPIYIYRCF